MNLNKLIEKATALARKSNVKRAKIGAILVTSSGQVIATAYNTRLDGYKPKFTIHAEEFVLLKANRMKAFDRFQNKELIMVTTRWSKTGKCQSRPCPNCLKEIYRHGIKTIIYTDHSGNALVEKVSCLMTTFH